MGLVGTQFVRRIGIFRKKLFGAQGGKQFGQYIYVFGKATGFAALLQFFFKCSFDIGSCHTSTFAGKYGLTRGGCFSRIGSKLGVGYFVV